MAFKACGRRDDDRLLDILRRARDGESLGQIAVSLGATKESVRVAARRVSDADLAESGEMTPAEMRAEYPWRMVK